MIRLPTLYVIILSPQTYYSCIIISIIYSPFSSAVIDSSTAEERVFYEYCLKNLTLQ
jgi:hypothetical protein